MIHFTTQFTYKQYFLGNLYRLLGRRVEQVFLFVFAFLFFMNVLGERYFLAIVCILFPISMYFILPLIKLLMAKWYYKVGNIEYFFSDDAVGYRFGEYTFEVKKEKIEYIQFLRHVIVVKVFRNKIYFVASKEQIEKTKNECLKTDYKALIVKK